MSKNDPPLLTDPYAGPTREPEPVKRDSSAPQGFATLVSGQAPPVGAPTVTPDKRARRRRVALGAAAALGGAALLAGIVAGGLALFTGRAAPVAPCPIADLPDATAYVERLPSSWMLLDVGDLSDVPQEAMWSHYADQFCGGTDLFQHLVRARSDAARRLAAGALVARRDTGDALECGRRLMAGHVGDVSYFVRVVVPPAASIRDPGDDDARPGRRARPSPEWFAIDRFSLEAVPDSSRRFRSWRDRGVLDGTHCRLAPDADRRADCQPSAPASARIAKTDLFVAATLENLEVYGREHGDGGDKATVARLEAIAKRVGGYDAAVIGTYEGFTASFPRRLGIAIARTDSSGAPGDEALFDVVDATEASFGIGDGFSAARGGRFRIELSPRRPRDADEVATALGAWRDRLVKDLQGREPDFEPLVGYSPLPAERDYRAMTHHTSLRALDQAEIENRDGVVSIDLDVRYDAEGDRLAEAYLAELAVRAKLAAQVVREVESGDKPDRDALLELGGSDLVGLVDHPGDGLGD